MSETKVVALLSDFGWQDVYVGVMKGAIACLNPRVKIIDISHQVPPQDIAAGRFCLMAAFSYFPAGTVFLAVVDPGVGSQRRGVAVQFAGGYLVGPDNGLFSGLLSQSPAIAAVKLTNPDYWRVSHPSSTFHGRDIFAPAAAHLASGVPLPMLGDEIPVDSLVQLPLRELAISEGSITGCVQYIDRFGNLITNLPAVAVRGQNWSVQVREIVIPAGETYSEVGKGEVVALIGSHGWLEIAVNQGNAQSQLGVDLGEEVRIMNYEL